MKNRFIYFGLSIIILIGCSQKKATNETQSEAGVVKLSKEAQVIRDYVPKNAVIAHRGSTFWVPEETEAAFRWARNIGADYLELDLQMTKDSVLIALHDDDLTRTTNIEEVFPERAKSPTTEFTLEELRSLDIGSWFNKDNPGQARESFEGIEVMTFRDVVMIAEGYRFKRENGEPVKELINNEWLGNYIYELDPADNGHRPGIYAETKKPKFEKLLAEELTALGWNINDNPKTVPTQPCKVGIANTKGRFVLQSFSPASIMKLEEYLPNIPKCFLLWLPAMSGDLETKYKEAIDFAVANNVHFIGPSISGKPNNYGELTAPWMVDMIHESELSIHPYSFDTMEQLEKYAITVEGVFTNRADLALEYYNRTNDMSAVRMLDELGY